VLHVRDRRSQRFGVAPKGNAVEKARRIDGNVDAGSRQLALLDQMVKPVGNLLIRDQLWRALIVACEFRDLSGIGSLSALRPTTNGQVPDVFGS
jgi:hypothetical protein